MVGRVSGDGVECGAVGMGAEGRGGDEMEREGWGSVGVEVWVGVGSVGAAGEV